MVCHPKLCAGWVNFFHYCFADFLVVKWGAMKKSDLTLDQIDKLLTKKLKPIERTLDSHTRKLDSHTRTLDSHTKQLIGIVQTQAAHSRSLADIENRIIPLAETVGAVVVDQSGRIGDVEGRVDDLEPRVSALEATA